MVSKKTQEPKQEPVVKTIQAKFWIYISNQGDGSAVAKFFDSEEAAEKYAENDDERFCEDIYKKTLEFSLNGKLITPNPVHWNAPKEDNE